MMTNEQRNALVGAVKACKSRELLEKYFGFNEVLDNAKEKNSVLIEAMGSPKVGFCGRPNEEEKYETLMHLFLSDIWQDVAAAAARV